MSNPGLERRNLRLLLTARGIRAFGDGFVSILIPVYLTGLGIDALGRRAHHRNAARPRNDDFGDWPDRASQSDKAIAESPHAARR